MSEIITFQVDAGEVWHESEITTIRQAALDIGKAIVRDLDHAREQPPGPSERPNADEEIPDVPTLMEPADAFLNVFARPVRFLRKAETPELKNWGFAARRDLIFVFRNAPHFFEDDNFAAVGNRPQFAVHELAHAFENVILDAMNTKMGRDSLPASLINRPNGFFHFKRYQQSIEITRGEIFADMFIGWVYDRWQLSNSSVPESPLTEAGHARKNFMADIMINLIQAAISHNRNS